MTFETTALYLPQDFTSHDLEFVERKDRSGNIVEERSHDAAVKMIQNPYWFDFDSSSSLTGNQRKQLQHKRAKRNHIRKIKKPKYVENNYEEVAPEEISTASSSYAIDTVLNIFNENDTLGMQNVNGLCLTTQSCAHNDIFFTEDSDLEDILEELRELESNNNFQEGMCFS